MNAEVSYRAGDVSPPAVEASDIWKRFASTQALRGVGVSLERGKCLGLVGRNGAGKSTLVSILSGIVAPDRGHVYFGGQPAPSLNDPVAWRSQIATVYQHSMVVPWLTVAENVFLGHYPTRWHGAIDWQTMRSQTRRIMHEWGFDLDERQRCADISVEQRQVVEIARALALGTRCLILDEPTSALERSGIARLFDRVRALVDAGVAVLYISHHLEEVFDICDSVAVLRDGALVLAAETGSLDKTSLLSAMVGETGEVGGSSGPKERVAPALSGKPRLVIEDIWVADPLGGPLEGVSLEVQAGEVLGVTGLRGSGASTVGRVAAGALAYRSGKVLVDGRALKPGHPENALELGVGYVPEDRRTHGFVPQLGVAENATMTIARKLSGRTGILSQARRNAAAKPLLEALQVAASGPGQPVAELSGGNQQKVTVARALIISPGVLVAVAPTRGVDVASKALLLNALASFVASAGTSLLLASEELDDLVICDRVLVMLHGRVFKEMRAPFDRAQLIAASEGIQQGMSEGAA